MDVQSTVINRSRVRREQVKASYNQLKIVIQNNCPDEEVRNFAIKLIEESELYALRAVHVKKDE